MSGFVTDGAAALAQRMVLAVDDDPVRRRALAVAFYESRPDPGSRLYRRAELAFVDWQLRRGVLAPASGMQPGSAWWRAVNARLLCDMWEAHHLSVGADGEPSRPAVARWLSFLDRPTPRSWYRAHNTSISSAYLEYRKLAQVELPLERFFMDVTLARLLFVHSMLPRLALGRYCWPIGRFASDPRSPTVDTYLSLRNVLPNDYPLTDQTVAEVLDAENFWGRLIDYGVLLPRLQELYEFAAEDLSHDHLCDFVWDGRPAYAWPRDQADVWTQRKFRRLGAVVRHLTAHK